MEITPASRTAFMSHEDKNTGKRRVIPKHGTPQGNAKRIVLVAIDVLRGHGDLSDLDDLKELVKVRCAALHLAYDAEVVGAAAEAALAQRARKRS